MTSRLINTLVLFAVAALLAGCKLEIVAVQGGDVTWNGGSCSEGSNCVVQITDPTFSDTFTVTPKPGYEFVKWHNGGGFLCGGSTSPICAITMPEDTNFATAIIDLFFTGRIMPLYNDVGIDTDGDTVRNELDEDDDNDGVFDVNDNCPLEGPDLDGFGCPVDPYIVTVNGRQWYQPDLFRYMNQQSIAAVCPGGACVGQLNGIDLTGWTWANGSDLRELIGPYIGTDYQSCLSSVIGLFSKGFRAWTFDDGDVIALYGGFYWEEVLGTAVYRALILGENRCSSVIVPIPEQDPAAVVNGSGWFYKD